MKTGDILISDKGEKRKILGVCDEMVFLSHLNKFSLYDYGCTHQYILDIGYKLEEKAWKPEIGEIYFYPEIDNSILNNWKRWEDDKQDNFRLSHNLVFKTAEEAITRAKEMLGIK